MVVVQTERYPIIKVISAFVKQPYVHQVEATKEVIASFKTSVEKNKL